MKKMLGVVDLTHTKKVDYLIGLGCDKVKHGNTTLLNHLMGVRDILKEKDAPEYLQDAGLFHSVYGTDYFKPQVTQNRLIVRELIGEQAEMLVWYFCRMTAPRAKKFLELEESTFRDDLFLIEEANRIDSRKEVDRHDWKDFYKDV
jgi:hypothetical protein